MYSIEPILQQTRIRQVLPFIEAGHEVLDIGCDDPPVLLNKIEAVISKGYGIDIVVKPRKQGKIEILRQDLQKKVVFPSNSMNVVTMLAVLEHMKYPKEMVRECFRILKPGGKILITVPSPRNKPVLEIFSRIGLVRKEMIDQHENYFTKKDLEEMLKKAGFTSVRVKYFELGFNTFVYGQK